jgi:hypothetical protein
MGMMKVVVLAAFSMALLSGCLMREPHWGNYGERPTQWSLPGPDYEQKVFGPMPFDEVKDFVRDRTHEGWDLFGYELASVPENIMIDETELDRPIDRKNSETALAKDAVKKNWTFDIPKTYDDGVDAPKKATVPPYLDEGVKPYRQKYLVIMRRWK